MSVKAPPPARAPLSKKKTQDGGASRKTSTRWGPHSANVRGRGWGSAKVKPDRVLLDVDVGASDELPFVIRQSFKGGRYSPSTSMEEREWQIMLEQFIASGVVVKNEIINIDSDWICLSCLCDVLLFASFSHCALAPSCGLLLKIHIWWNRKTSPSPSSVGLSKLALVS
jgi:hypothetical protein